MYYIYNYMLYNIFNRIRIFINSLLCRKRKNDDNDEVVHFLYNTDLDIENM